MQVWSAKLKKKSAKARKFNPLQLLNDGRICFNAPGDQNNKDIVKQTNKIIVWEQHYQQVKTLKK